MKTARDFTIKSSYNADFGLKTTAILVYLETKAGVAAVGETFFCIDPVSEAPPS